MATTKLSATKSTSRAINYAEKRAEEKSGLNCDIDYAKSSFKATRELYGKTGGNEGHVIIQSFKPGEVTPEQCNQLGLALAEKFAPNHQVAVYTHNDTDHVHNHIVINSIDLETGKKFNNNKQALRDLRDFNDDVCREHSLSVPEKDTARLRYTQTEKAIADPNTKSTAQYSWKDEIREAIDQSTATNMDEFKDHLSQYGIEIARVTPKSITYRHLAEDKKVRGRRLGEDYNKGGIEDGFERQIQRQQQEREDDNDIQPKRPTSNRDEPTQRDTGVTQSDWDKFAQDTNELKRRRQAAESARLADEKARRDREERERAKQASRTIIDNDRDHGLEL
ncbi:MULTISPECIES: relaxase/mobilization nuclease domain-containing protein [Staphylococcus]|uniref:relaxase/mobilization nuclease domain-containing protein n=1 Tax=Staphylococcus TaxID=1279 RepID=UPI00069F290D|nr:MULTISPECIES: relaxase/mobilization nuclease domain-containing protein [Staphylococcus]PBI74370.1 protein rlx [Staphylococcus aureus]HAX0070300.1 relaxase/mobilization nuclease domain-containing protein [Escherichia coli JJ1886]MBC3103986.1 relaxase/mobilization nuclease domain-containing protein [Staphylococcus haemolyticus]MBC3144842.1 relaxase/mobilization nuclease domain-containing protein [Staphylococcus haemolyticus]MCH4335393.1 relaxase/mobilization nuclease domain-containing protein